MKRLIVMLALIGAACSKDSNPAPAPTPPAPAATLSSVALTAPLGNLTRVGATAQVTATGTYSDGSLKDVTSSCISWASSNTVVLTITTTGLITAQGSGVALITGSCLTKSVGGTITITLTTAAPPTGTNLVLSGHVTDSTSGGVLPGITMALTSGPNAGKSVKTNSSGDYSLEGLTGGSYALEASATGYVTQSKTGSLSGNARLDFVLQRVAAPTPPPSPTPPSGGSFRVSGTGDSVFTIPSSVTRVRIDASYPGSCQNFIVHIAGRLVVNVIIGTCSVADTRSPFSGTYAISGGQAEITGSTGVSWTFTQQ